MVDSTCSFVCPDSTKLDSSRPPSFNLIDLAEFPKIGPPRSFVLQTLPKFISPDPPMFTPPALPNLDPPRLLIFAISRNSVAMYFSIFGSHRSSKKIPGGETRYRDVPVSTSWNKRGQYGRNNYLKSIHGKYSNSTKKNSARYPLVIIFLSRWIYRPLLPR